MQKFIPTILLLAAASLAQAQPQAPLQRATETQCLSFGQAQLHAPYTAEIVTKANDKGITVRVIDEQKKHQFISTMDYRTDRLTIFVLDGKVIRALCG